MADTPSPLEKLADISEPELILNFALAPIWWLLIALLLIGLLFLAVHCYQRWRYFSAKREALTLLDNISNDALAAASINQLLKRVIQHYQPHHPALSLSITQWQHWLSTECNQPLPDLSLLLYQQGHHAEAVTQFQQFAKAWLIKYRGAAPTSAVISEASHA